jgi:uncharacterized protein (TIGR02246 family)
MKRFIFVCMLATMALTMAGCKPADTHDADVQALQAEESQWNQDWAAKDPDKIASYYADDAVLMTPGGDPISGKPAIVGSLKAMVADPALDLKFHSTSADVAKSGDIGYTQGVYTMTMTDPQSKQVIHDHGSYVTTYRKGADGSWKAVADIASSGVPMSPPAAAMQKK